MVKRRDTLTEGSQLREYIEKLLIGINTSSSKREFTFQADSTDSPLLCVITHAYGLMESFHSNPFAVIFSRLVITMTHFPHS